MSDDDAAREEPADEPARSPARVVVILIGALLGALALWFLRPGGGASESGDTEAAGSETGELEGPRSSVVGVLRIEVDPQVFPSGGETEGETEGGAGEESGTGDDPGEVELAPPDGECRIRAWREGEALSGPVACSAEGGFTLEVPADPSLPFWVELEIPGRLRGLVEVEAPAPAGEEVDLGTIALGLGFTVRGQIVDARDGTVVERASLQAMPRPNLGEPVPWRAAVEEGSFVLDTLPAGPVEMRAVAPGYAMAVVEALAPEEGVLVALDRLHDLSGSATAPAEVLARARVRLEGSSVWPAVERMLEPDGSFVFEQLPDGVYGVEVVARAAEGAPQEWASIPLENVTPDLRVSVALIPAYRVPVKVVDSEGNPVTGARVTVGYASIGMLHKRGDTDGMGEAQVGPVVPGEYVVSADAEGYLPAAPVPTEVGTQGEVEEVALVLARPARVEGIVVDQEDRPVEGAAILLESEEAFAIGQDQTRARLRSVADDRVGSLGVTAYVPDLPRFDMEVEHEDAGVWSDADGRFVLEGLVPGTHRIRAVHGQHAGSPTIELELSSGETRTGVRWKLREGAPLTGVVRSGNGEPLVGATVEMPDGMVLATDERGVFDAGYWRGKVRLIVRAPGMVPKAVDVRLGDEALDVPVALEDADGRLAVRVRDGNGRPVEDAELTLRMLDGLSATEIGWTDGSGTVDLDKLVSGGATIEVRHPDFVDSSAAVQVDARASTLDVVLDPGWAIEVLVRSVLRGDRIRNAAVRAGAVQARTDAEGTARLDHLGEARVELEVRAEGWVSVRRNVTRPETDLLSETIELEEAGVVEGSIVDERGEPVVGAAIEVVDASGEVIAQTRSGARGKFEFPELPPGDVRVVATPPDALADILAATDAEVDVRRDAPTRDLQLRFERL